MSSSNVHTGFYKESSHLVVQSCVGEVLGELQLVGNPHNISWGRKASMRRIKVQWQRRSMEERQKHDIMD